MGFSGQLLLGIGGYVKGKRDPAEGGEGKAVVPESHEVTAAAAAVLLGTKIVLMEVAYCRGKEPVPGGAVLVDITLEGTQAVIDSILHGLGKEKPQPEAGQFGKVRIPLYVHMHTDPAAEGDGPHCIDIHDPLYSGSQDADFAVDLYCIFEHGPFCCIGAGTGPVVHSSLPLHSDIPVVVRRSTPDIQFHRLIQNFFVLKRHFFKNTVQSAVDVVETLSLEDQPALILLHANLFHLVRTHIGIFFHGDDHPVSPISLQRDLIKAEKHTLLPEFIGLPKKIKDLHINLSFFGEGRQGQEDPACFPRKDRRDLRRRDHTSRDPDVIAGHFVFQSDILLQINKIHLILDVEDACGLGIAGMVMHMHGPGADRIRVICLQSSGAGRVRLSFQDLLNAGSTGPGNNAGGAVNVFIFQEPCVGRAVGIDKAVHTEIAVVGILSVVPAIIVDRSAVRRRSLVNGMVAPLPDKTSADAVVVFHQAKIVLVISCPIAHGMAVLAHDKGLFRIRLRVADDIFKGRIHPAVEIDVGMIEGTGASRVPGALIVGQARGVIGFGPAQGFLKGAAVAALVSHGPDHHAGAVFVPVHQLFCAVEGSCDKGRVVRYHFIPAGRPLLICILPVAEHPEAMALIVRLVDDKKAVPVAHLIKHGSIGVVAGPDGVEIITFHHLQIPAYMVDSDHRAAHRVPVMTVHAPEPDGTAVDQDNISLHRDLPDTDLFSDHFTAGLHKKRIQIRILTAPQMGVFYGKLCFTFKLEAADLIFFGIQKRRGHRYRLFQIFHLHREHGALRAGHFLFPFLPDDL